MMLMKHIRKFRLKRSFRSVFEEKGVKADPTLAVHAGQFFRILSTDYVKLYDGVIDLLEAFKKEGQKDLSAFECTAHFYRV